MRGQEVVILYASVCSRYELGDEMGKAWKESIPYSDRAINIMIMVWRWR